MSEFDRCHAGACHGKPSDRGCAGWLCEPCWWRLCALIARLCGRSTARLCGMEP